MNNNLKEYVWVFVGCGGTFYAASPYLAVLAKRYYGTQALFLDPDAVRSDNFDRQWPGFIMGESKVELARNALGLPSALGIVGRFDPVDRSLNKATEGRPVLAIVNVDNDEARLNVADWLSSRISTGIMVVSGCEKTLGQCYPGVWNEGEAILDWRTLHPDVGHTSGSSDDPCNAQTIRSNALTGVLVGMCIEDIAEWLTSAGSHEVLSEFYWDIDPETDRVKMWELLVPTRRAVSA